MSFLLPHIGAAAVESRTNMGMVALDNIDAVLIEEPFVSRFRTFVTILFRK
jgi:lactate dehydrogenase-like 2-hydroxyacid dehydrogenase